MASHKRSARQRQQAAFAARASDMDDVFAREDRRRQRLDERKDAARRHKACSSKNRYASKAEAKAAITDCEAHGTRGLSCYRCTYCNGWHLTSHPWQEQARHERPPAGRASSPTPRQTITTPNPDTGGPLTRTVIPLVVR